MNKDTYDLIIIGGGVAGMTAAIYAARAGLMTVIIEKAGFGGQAALTAKIENYPSFREIEGFELAAKMKEQVDALGVDMKPNTLTMRLNVTAGRLFNEHRIQYQNKHGHGARQITLANRTAANAERIAALVKAAAPECEVVVTSPTDNLLRQMLRNVELVLQCTSLGLHEGDALPVPPEWIPVNTPVFDFVYTPSQFKERLVAQGNRVSNGLEMLLQQGCKSFELWTGQPAPVEAMRQALYQNEE